MTRRRPVYYWTCDAGHTTVARHRPLCSVCTGPTEKHNTQKHNRRLTQEKVGWVAIPTTIVGHPADDLIGDKYWYEFQCTFCGKFYHWNQLARMVRHRVRFCEIPSHYVPPTTALAQERNTP